MAETLLLVTIGTLLVVGATIIVIAGFILRNARRSVELAGDRMTYLREELDRLSFLREEHGSLKEELRQEREQHLEAERRAEEFKQKYLLLRQDQEQLVEELEQEHEKYLEARRRAERLSQERLLLQQEHNQLTEELKREREQHLEVQRRAERLRQEWLLLRQEQGQLAEGLAKERLRHLEAEQRAWQEQEGWEQERRARRDAERTSDHLERQIQELREIQQDQKIEQIREVRQKNSLPVPEGLSDGQLETRELLEERSLPKQKAQGAGRMRRPASSPESHIPETASELAEGTTEDKRPRLGVWHPHPDDGAISQGGAPAKQARAHSDAPVKVDHKHYDKYLENYQGYVELAEKLYQTRDNGEVLPGSPAEREWEKRLRRVNDGIGRTTARLDILEEYNPELATDDRISHRASIARRQSKLEK